MNEPRGSNHVLGVTAVAANHTNFRARRTPDGIFITARLAFSTALDTLHNDRVVFGEFRESSARCDNDSRKLMSGNDGIFSESAFVVTEPAFKNLEIRSTNDGV